MFSPPCWYRANTNPTPKRVRSRDQTLSLSRRRYRSEPLAPRNGLVWSYAMEIRNDGQACPSYLKNFASVSSRGGLVTSETMIIATVELSVIAATGSMLRKCSTMEPARSICHAS